jgi:hypothetical protein
MTNKYTYSVPFTEEDLYRAYVIDGLSQYECAKRLGVSQRVIWRAMKKMGVPARTAAKRDQYGPKNDSWKGGRVLAGAKPPNGCRFLSARNPNKGYYMVKCPGHPNANKQGYVFEHVKIALDTVGLGVMPPECCIHHINFVRADNRPENLVLCAIPKHREYHGKLENVVGELYDKGIVGFDPEIGYFVRGGDAECQ